MTVEQMLEELRKHHIEVPGHFQASRETILAYAHGYFDGKHKEDRDLLGFLGELVPVESEEEVPTQ